MLVQIYCLIDDFAKENYTVLMEDYATAPFAGKKLRGRLTLPEVATILVYYHFSGYADFKSYYVNQVLAHMRRDFPDLVSYNRFVELLPGCMPLLGRFLRANMAAPSGIYFIDSTKLEACHIARASQNRGSKGAADFGKSSTGWFFGFKLHLVIDAAGGLVDFVFSRGSCPDNKAGLLSRLTKGLSGVMFGDRGYLMNREKALFINHGEFLILAKPKTAGQKKTYKDQVSSRVKAVHKKRGVIESCIGVLKKDLKLWDTGYRSLHNALTKALSCLCAYVFRQGKPHTEIDFVQKLLMAA